MGGYVYFFAQNRAEGSAEKRNLLGGKGANLAEMANLGIRVPPISTEVCRYYTAKHKYPDNLEQQIKDNLKKVEQATDRRFGSRQRPLLVSVRSGARISMPGMMDTVLNLGLNDASVEGLIQETNNNVVLGVPGEKFEKLIEKKKEAKGVQDDIELTGEDLKELTDEFKELVEKEKGIEFPQDSFEQLRMAIDAVFASWNNKRAISYRKINKIPEHWGTAVNVQTMVFGNMGDNSGTGVGFTRNCMENT